MKLEGLGELLGIKRPWVVKSTEVHHSTNVLDIYIDFERGTQFACPCCNELSPVYDSSTKRVRHLDVFEYRSYLNIKVPRIKCERDGVKVVHYDP
jgi:transposase